MNLRIKNVIYTLGLISAVFLVWYYRQNTQPEPVVLQGATMGTTYHIKYFDNENRDFQVQIDSILKAFNQSVSTYIPTSEISRFNSYSTLQFETEYFKTTMAKSAEITRITSGAFDPTVMPLVNVWGFGPEERKTVDSVYIDSLKAFVGFDKVIAFNNYKAWKLDNRATIDFSAIAKGYGVDVVAGLLKENGIENLFVEIGGEVYCEGNNLKTGNPWRIAIIDPGSDITSQTFIAQLEPGNKGVATSANNFNYRIVDGVKYSHTISPFTGFPIKQAILSATVIMDDCMTADGLATAFMVMGHEKAMELVEKEAGIEAFLIFSNPSGKVDYYISDGLKSKIKLLN